MNKIYIVFSFLFFTVLQVTAQSGGSNFPILNTSLDARSMALAGNSMLTLDADIGKGIYNPSLLNPKMNGNTSIDNLSLGNGISLTQLSYVKENKKFNLTQSYSLQFGNYGKQDETTVDGRIIGEFKPYDLVLQSGVSKKLNEQIQVGAQVKWIHSSIVNYFSQGLYVDFSGIYISKNKKTIASVLVRNLGYKYKKFSENSTRNNPLEIKVSVANKPEHMPLRWMITLEQIQEYNLIYDDPDDYEFNDFEQTKEYNKPSVVNNILRHVNIAGELVFTENFNFRLGYDFARRQELSSKNLKGTTGFSWGFSFKALKKYKISYARSTYHLAGPLNTFSLQFNVDNLYSKIF